MSPVSFIPAHAEALKALLPPLAFGGREGVDVNNPLLRSYCASYGLDFSTTDEALTHVMGKVRAAGFDIATQYWIPANPCGTLVVIHGYYDHVGIYNKAIAFALEQGLAVLAFDLPGHGLSGGERVAIDSFDQYGDVLHTVLQRAKPNLPAPFFAMGQSTGGAVLLNYLWRFEADYESPMLERIALCAPLIIPRDWRQRGRFAYAMLHRFVNYLPRGRSFSSHDPEFIRFIDEQDCLQSTRLSVRWVGAMKAWNEQFCQFPILGKRLLVIQGDQDGTVDWRYNLQQIQLKLPAARIVMVAGAGHQLVNEQVHLREQVFTQISRFFFND